MSYIPLGAPLPPPALDALLERGWYRTGQAVFTTAWLILEEHNIISQVLWARVGLAGWMPGRRYRRLAAQNRHFKIGVSEAVITPEVEELFSRYRACIDFNTGHSAADILLGERTQNFFPTRMWTIRDGGELIGAGYFDEGRETVAGILNFYHPDYRLYSLGLWLYLETIRWAAEAGKRWYYPGYIALDYPKFDYKLLAGKETFEVLDAECGEWVAYDAAAMLLRGIKTVQRR